MSTSRQPAPNPRPGKAPRKARSSPARKAPRVSAALLAAALRAQSAGVLIAKRATGARGMRILFVNDSLCEMIGRDATELIGQSHSLLHADAADLSRLKTWLASARPGQPLTGDGLLRRKDGSTFSAAWSYDPLFDDAGRLMHIVATYRDQTERRRMQDTLVHAQRLDAVGRLAGGVAHDFNNLISVINGYCEILAAHVAANPQALREVAEIHNAGRKAAALTQQLLAFSRRQPFDSRVINLNTLVEENADILSRFVAASGKVELDLAPDLPNTRTDPAQFQQVLLNLVLNARDALRDRGRIVVSTSLREVGPASLPGRNDISPGLYVSLSVADNGTGMDAETLKHLFEPFFTTKPEGKGTGLGLALVYGVVQQSGGYILVRSELLVGSTFEILLPATDAPAAAPLPGISPLPSLRGSETIVLIEQDDVVRKMVAGILAADGYRVTAAGSLAELRGTNAPARPPQLIMSPVTPDVEKYGRQQLKANPGLRFLWIRHGEDAKDAVSWAPAACQASLLKPYALSELVKATRRLLDS